jgi:hypothetical protein
VTDGSGGAFVAWQSTANPNASDDDLYASHFLADGSVGAGWATGGYPLAVYNSYQSLGDVAADSTGSALFAWYDHRTYPPLVYLQRLQPNGAPAPGFQAGGNPVSTVSGYQFAPRLAPDGAGGAFVVFQEAFGGRSYVQRMASIGVRAPGWPAAGVALVDPAVGSRQDEYTITPDGSGGAIVAWNDSRNGIQDQIYAQRYTGQDITGVATALTSFESLPDRVTLHWSHGGDAPDEVSVERGESGVWRSLGSATFDGGGRLDFVDASVVAGARYEYRLAWLDAGVERQTAATSIEVPRAVALAIEGLRPNPAVGDLNVAFSLPSAEPATLEVLDVGGRMMRRREVGSLGFGRHVVRMDDGASLHPGAYLLRLTSGERRILAKGVVLR